MVRFVGVVGVVSWCCWLVLLVGVLFDYIKCSIVDGTFDNQ